MTPKSVCLAFVRLVHPEKITEPSRQEPLMLSLPASCWEQGWGGRAALSEPLSPTTHPCWSSGFRVSSRESKWHSSLECGRHLSASQSPSPRRLRPLHHQPPALELFTSCWPCPGTTRPQAQLLGSREAGVQGLILSGSVSLTPACSSPMGKGTTGLGGTASRLRLLRRQRATQRCTLSRQGHGQCRHQHPGPLPREMSEALLP